MFYMIPIEFKFEITTPFFIDPCTLCRLKQLFRLCIALEFGVTYDMHS